MSVDTPEPEATEQTRQIALRREALLPNERGRGLGTVAVVCTMAGIASGLALATTLMAMQVADSMSVRPTIHYVQQVEPASDSGFLGIHYVTHHGSVEILGVLPRTPAKLVGLQKGDRIVSINGDLITSDAGLQSHIFGEPPGSEIVLVIERDGVQETTHPILAPWPARGGS